MNKNEFSWEAFSRIPIIGIIRNFSIEQVQHILPVYVESGLTTVEITMNTPSAAKIIEYAVHHFGEQLNIGAGTVCDVRDLEEALAAGAQFIVTPILGKKVVKHCVKAGIPVFPGAYSPTEIYRAWKLGASVVKVYPATSLHPEYMKDIKAPLNQVKLLPTGGITLHNLSDFMKMGADGLGIGGHLFDQALIEKEDWIGLKRHFETFVKTLNEIKRGHED